MTTLETTAGILLVGLVLRDIFHTLFHPSGFGTIARSTFVSVWRGTRFAWRRGRGSELAGPAALVLVIALWALGVVGGFALVYHPRLESFTVGPGHRAATTFGTALYVSTVAVSTLGLGDVVPVDGPMRTAIVLEALIGFLLLTAAISWVLQLYPALTRRRVLARSLHTLHRTRYTDLLRAGSGPSDAVLLDGLRQQLATGAVDLEQYRESYYFRESKRETALAATLPVARAVADCACAPSSHFECRRAGRRLRAELDTFQHQVADVIGASADDDPIGAYAADHEHRPFIDHAALDDA